MPAKNPRLTITLQPTLAAQLRKLSELTGNSQSSLIGDLLEGSGPVFDRMIKVMEAAKTAKSPCVGASLATLNRLRPALKKAWAWPWKVSTSGLVPCLMRQRQ